MGCVLRSCTARPTGHRTPQQPPQRASRNSHWVHYHSTATRQRPVRLYPIVHVCSFVLGSADVHKPKPVYNEQPAPVLYLFLCTVYDMQIHALMLCSPPITRVHIVLRWKLRVRVRRRWCRGQLLIVQMGRVMVVRDRFRRSPRVRPVSYTHLTLPTKA